MPAQWRIIDCSKLEGSIKSVRGGVVISKAGESETTVPVSDVAVLLVGMSANISAAALHRLMEADVTVLVCDWKGVPTGAAYAWSEHGRVGARTRAQAAASEPRKKNAWGRIIKAKIAGQAQVLRDNHCTGADELSNLVSKVRSGDPQNLEAQAAKLYWQGYATDDRFRRIPGDNEHELNACLNYGYTVLRGFGVQAVLSAGLSPALGVFHRGRGNNFALVDDLIEPLRPAVDDGILQMSSWQIEESAVRQDLVAIASRAFAEDGRTTASVFREFAQHYGQYIEGDLDFLPVPQWRGAV